MKNTLGIIILFMVVGFIVLGCDNTETSLPVLTGTVTIDNTSPKVGDYLYAYYNDGNGHGEETWQWLRNGVVIPDTNNYFYNVTEADLNNTLSARITFSFRSGSITSLATNAVAPGDFVCDCYPDVCTCGSNCEPGCDCADCYDPGPDPGPGGTIILSEDSLERRLEWLSKKIKGDRTYIVEVDDDESITPKEFRLGSWGNFVDIEDTTIIIRGIGSERTITLSEVGSMFMISVGVTMILEENIILHGISGNETALVRVFGTLIMEEGSKITGNHNTSFDGGGVYIGGYDIFKGLFIMRGGIISGNSAERWGGGVSIEFGVFDMRGGTISGNSAHLGGGVHNRGNFFFSNGIIYGINASTELRNTSTEFYGGDALVNYYYQYGFSPEEKRETNIGSFNNDVFTEISALFHGIDVTIQVKDGVFQGREGSIAEQFAWLDIFAQDGFTYLIEISEDEECGNLSYFINSNFTIIFRSIGEKRTISKNEAGVLFGINSGITMVFENICLKGIDNNINPLIIVGGTMIMKEGSEIFGNINTTMYNYQTINGSGVAVIDGGTFYMYEGEIYGNLAWTFGSGVFVYDGGIFEMFGGTIYGNDDYDEIFFAQAGSGVYNTGTFRISNGIIYGSDAAEELRNASALSGTAELGTFNNGEFNKIGEITGSTNTIHVIEGVLQ